MLFTFSIELDVKEDTQRMYYYDDEDYEEEEDYLNKGIDNLKKKKDSILTDSIAKINKTKKNSTKT